MIPALPELGGMKMNPIIVEYVLWKKGVVDQEFDYDPREDFFKMNITKSYGKHSNMNQDESDEEDNDTRGYAHNNHFETYKK